MASTNTPPAKVEEVPSYGNELGISMVDILVGPSKTLFHVHKDRLCSRVPYFDKMFNGQFKEAGERQAELPEEDCDAFNLFLEWLYTNRLPIFDITKHNPANAEKSPFRYRIKLYCFAEKHCLPELMDLTITSLVTNYKEHARIPGFDTIQYVYENTAAGSHLRNLMGKYLQHVTIARSDKSGGGAWPTEELCDLMMGNRDLAMDLLKLLRKSEGVKLETSFFLKPCLYHTHEEGKECSVE